MAALRVLIADDDRLTACLLKMDLEQQGYCVVGAAHTGRQALNLCRQHAPDVVLMDVQMPEMDGLEATRTLMCSQPVCVVLVTAQEHLEQAAEQAGAMGYLLKPVSSLELPSLLEAARLRFNHFCDLAGENGPQALPEWCSTRQTVRALMKQEGLSEEAAFARLSGKALASTNPTGT